MAVASRVLLVNLPRADLLGFLAVFWNRRWRDEGTGGPPRRPSGQRSALPGQVSPGPSPRPPPGPICSLPGGVGLRNKGVMAGWPGFLGQRSSPPSMLAAAFRHHGAELVDTGSVSASQVQGQHENPHPPTALDTAPLLT